MTTFWYSNFPTNKWYMKYIVPTELIENMENALTIMYVKILIYEELWIGKVSADFSEIALL